ncbi:MAG: fibronectin type III domain-containing protein, partial [Bifidobacteriaceae bacterium]|nr:fibronectin type III domain-containing protein [Bifidobacteriaceae bacterium]
AVVESANQCADELLWGPESNSEIPAGKPAAPAAPTVERLQPVAGQAQFRISWTPPAANGDAIRRYDVEVSRGGAVVETIAPSEGPAGTHAIKTFATSTEDYTFRVRASNKAGDGAWSAASSPIRPVIAPGQVANLTKTAEGDGQVTISIGTAAGNGAKTDEITYHYRLSDGRTGTLSASTGTALTGLSNTAGCYTVTVWSVSNVQGISLEGPSTQLSGLCPYGRPNKPGVSASGGVDTVSLSWSFPSANGRPVTKVQISVDGGAWQDKTGNGSVTAGNGRDQTHSIKARAVDSQGQISAEASTSASTWGGPSVQLSRGAVYSGTMRFLVVEMWRFAPNSQVTCTWDVTAGRGPYHMTVTVDGNGHWGPDRFYDASKYAHVYSGYDGEFITCGGVRSWGW